jgi:hypothetical protein
MNQIYNSRKANMNQMYERSVWTCERPKKMSERFFRRGFIHVIRPGKGDILMNP